MVMLRSSIFKVVLQCLVVVSMLVSQFAAAESPMAGKQKFFDSSQFYQGDYLIGVDDVIEVSVWRNPDLSVSVPVRPDGKISTPLVKDVMAAGKTPKELADIVTDQLAKYIRDPQVSIIVTGLNSHEYVSRVRVTGAVNAPASVPHRMGMTVLDIILAAGGVSEFASANRTTLYRRTPDGKTKSIRIKLDDILKKGKLDTNVLLQPGDVLTVPEGIF
ncbi:MAG: XrtA/PEP-CTERM system exopolysaccharide export protein [Pseudomonadota bacterium]|nr:XrtA/PEP-CTERM system exopolysaccharide export protein [Pseudomonadota bacterium]